MNPILIPKGAKTSIIVNDDGSKSIQVESTVTQVINIDALKSQLAQSQKQLVRIQSVAADLQATIDTLQSNIDTISPVQPDPIQPAPVQQVNP